MLNCEQNGKSQNFWGRWVEEGMNPKPIQWLFLFFHLVQNSFDLHCSYLNINSLVQLTRERDKGIVRGKSRKSWERRPSFMLCRPVKIPLINLAVSWPSQISPTEQRKTWNGRLLLVSLRWSGAFLFSRHVTDVCYGQWSFWIYKTQICTVQNVQDRHWLNFRSDP